MPVNLEDLSAKELFDRLFEFMVVADIFTEDDPSPKQKFVQIKEEVLHRLEVFGKLKRFSELKRHACFVIVKPGKESQVFVRSGKDGKDIRGFGYNIVHIDIPPDTLVQEVTHKTV